MTEGELVGKVIHVYDRIGVAVLRLQQDLNVGDRVHFLGRNTDFEQEITSMEVEHQKVEKGAAGSEVAVKIKQRARSGDSVYRLPKSA